MAIFVRLKATMIIGGQDVIYRFSQEVKQWILFLKLNIIVKQPISSAGTVLRSVVDVIGKSTFLAPLSRQTCSGLWYQVPRWSK